MLTFHMYYNPALKHMHDDEGESRKRYTATSNVQGSVATRQELPSCQKISQVDGISRVNLTVSATYMLFTAWKLASNFGIG